MTAALMVLTALEASWPILNLSHYFLHQVPSICQFLFQEECSLSPSPTPILSHLAQQVLPPTHPFFMAYFTQHSCASILFNTLMAPALLFLVFTVSCWDLSSLVDDQVHEGNGCICTTHSFLPTPSLVHYLGHVRAFYNIY